MFKNKMIHINKLIALILAATFLECLFGCNNLNNKGLITSNINIDSYCAGMRTITCALNQNSIEKSISGGKSALDSFMSINCPQELSFACPDENTYEFNLKFTDLTDYKAKASALTGRSVNIIFGAPDNIFAKGFHLKEDFSNQDLMKWFYDNIYKEGLLTQETDIWSFGDTTVNHNENLYTSSSTVDIIDLNYIPVDKISMNTNKFGESFKRTVSFQISNQSLSAAVETVNNYMMTLVPPNSTSGWSNMTDGKIFTISFDAANENELQLKTNTVLDNQFNFISYSKQNKTFFNSTKTLTEELNFSCFPSNREGKTFVEYTFTFDDNNSANTVFTSNNGRLINISKTIENNSFTLSQDTDVLNMSITNVDEYKIGAVKIDMAEISPANFRRDIEITFDGNNSSKGAEIAKQYIDSFNIQYLSTQSGPNSCVISIGSTVEEINLALGELFTKENSLTVSIDNSFKLYNDNALKDNIDMSDFLLRIGYSGQIEYNMYSLNKLVSAEKLDLSGQVMQINTDNNKFSLLIQSPGKALVTSLSQRLNIFYVVVLTAVGLGVVLILLLLAYYLFSKFREKNEKFIITDRKCQNCGEPIYESMSFCVKCGEPVDNFSGEFRDDICKHCKAQIYEGMKFCIKCGEPLDEDGNCDNK